MAPAQRYFGNEENSAPPPSATHHPNRTVAAHTTAKDGGGAVTVFPVKDRAFWTELSDAAAKDVAALEAAQAERDAWRAEAAALERALGEARAELADKSEWLSTLQTDRRASAAEELRLKASIDREALRDDVETDDDETDDDDDANNAEFNDLLADHPLSEDGDADAAAAFAEARRMQERLAADDGSGGGAPPREIAVTAAAFASQAAKDGDGFWLEAHPRDGALHKDCPS